jgi:hypothetical protein
MWLDSTDAGGMFRASVRHLCAELQAPPRKLADGSLSTPLLVGR